jgi:hypothetical protein
MMQQRLALLASADLDSAMDKSSLEVAIKQLLVSEQTV